MNFDCQLFYHFLGYKNEDDGKAMYWGVCIKCACVQNFIPDQAMNE